VPQCVGFVQLVELPAEVELADDLLHVVGETVEVIAKVRFELLRLVEQSPERELRRVIERLPGGLFEGLRLIRDTRLVEFRLHRQHVIVRRLQQTIETANDRHRQDDIAILAPDVHISQNIIRDAPDKVDNGVVLRVVHKCLFTEDFPGGNPILVYSLRHFRRVLQSRAERE
jgi:hypothetical protein